MEGRVHFSPSPLFECGCHQEGNALESDGPLEWQVKNVEVEKTSFVVSFSLRVLPHNGFMVELDVHLVWAKSKMPWSSSCR